MVNPTIDARGKPCPQPVVETRKILMETDARRLRVIVDNQASAENVTRMARNMGCEVRTEKRGPDEIHLSIAPHEVAVGATGPSRSRPESPETSPSRETDEPCGRPPQNVVLISSSNFGRGNDELGGVLMRSFIQTLKEVPQRPVAILFVNSGIHLTTEGSDLVEDIQELADMGVQVFSCSTCLDYYHLKEKLQVGQVTNMFEIVSQLASADRIIRP